MPKVWRRIYAGGVDQRVTLREGRRYILRRWRMSRFRYDFIDADKPNNPHYLRWALFPPRTLIIGDNVRDGEVVNPQSAFDERVQACTFH